MSAHKSLAKCVGKTQKTTIAIAIHHQSDQNCHKTVETYLTTAAAAAAAAAATESGLHLSRLLSLLVEQNFWPSLKQATASSKCLKINFTLLAKILCIVFAVFHMKSVFLCR